MRLQTDFMRQLLLRGAPHVAYASIGLTEIQRQGVRALYTFFRISRDLVDKAASRVESQISVQHLNRLFEESNIDDAVEVIPDLGLAWEAWLGLEEEFNVPRTYAIEFARGLQMETENFRPQTTEDLLQYCYRTGGVLGIVVCHILGAPEAAMQSMVDAGSAARLTSLAQTIRHDFLVGRCFAPTEWFPFGIGNFTTAWAAEASARYEQLAFVLYNSARDMLNLLPLSARMALMIPLAIHKEKMSSRLRRFDRVIDEFLRQFFGNIIVYLRAIYAISRSEFPAGYSSARHALPPRDVSLALRNQNLRLGRDL